MPIATEIYSTVFKNGSATMLARVVGADAQPIVQADIASATYSVFLLDGDDPNGRTAVTGQTDVSLTVADIIFDTLQTDDLWTVDDTGYNFRHVLDVSAAEAFAVAGRACLVEYRLTPVAGQVIVIRFRVNVI